MSHKQSLVVKNAERFRDNPKFVDDATENDGRVGVRSDSANGMANITITDTGCGMSSAFIRERLFRPFDSTKGSQSMGIGAYQARNYVRTLGGQMEVTSEVGVGTTFSVRLHVNE